MKVTSLEDGALRIDLTAEEARLLRLALERATFIDTPAGDQAAIMNFCTRALDALAR
jgi:hypothetical protein